MEVSLEISGRSALSQTPSVLTTSRCKNLDPSSFLHEHVPSFGKSIARPVLEVQVGAGHHDASPCSGTYIIAYLIIKSSVKIVFKITIKKPPFKGWTCCLGSWG
jgi:hypothetical protein